MKRTVAWTAAAVLLCASAPAFAQEWEMDTSPVTLTVYSDRGWFAPWEGPAAERVTARTGVTLDVRKPLEDDSTGEGINLMIASNDWPDLMIVDWNNPGVAQLMDAGLVWDVNELIDRYAPSLRGFLNDNIGPELLSGYAHTDGKTYRIGFGGFLGSKDSAELADVGFSIPCWLPRFVVRQDYFDEIGAPDIRTADQFYDAVKAMAANHPGKFAVLGDQNTKHAWFTYHFGTNHTWGNYYADPGAREIKYYTSHPQFPEAIKFMNRLAREGLYPEEALVWTREVSQNWVAGNVIVSMGNGCHHGDPIGETGTTNHVLPPWDTYAYSLWRTPWMADLFPTRSDKSDRAIRFVQYAAGRDGYIDMRIGIEGDTWTGDLENGPHFQFRPDVWTTDVFPEGVPIWLDGFQELAAADYANVVAAGFNLPPILNLDGIAPGGPRWSGPSEDALAYTELMSPYFTSGPELYVPIRGDSDVGVIRERVDTLFDDYFARMVFAETEAEAVSMIAEFREKAAQAGLAQYEAEATRIYRDNLAKSGM